MIKEEVLLAAFYSGVLLGLVVASVEGGYWFLGGCGGGRCRRDW